MKASGAHTKKILLVIDDKSLLSAAKKSLAKLDCRVLEASGDLAQVIFDEVPHLIVIDESYDRGEGKRHALNIKHDAVLEYIPIILLLKQPNSASSRDFEKIEYFIQKDRIASTLPDSVREVLVKNHNELDLNPLTHLPGTRSSVSRLDRSVRSKKVFAVLCIDLTNLAAFNNAYGDARGDEIIIRLAKIIKEAIKFKGSSDDFLGHLGGDDFMVVTKPDASVAIAEAIIKQFDTVITTFYDPHDREQGYLVQRNKEGVLTHYPLMSVSIAVVTSRDLPVLRMSEISAITGELKKYMKTIPGSCYIEYKKKPSEKKNSPKDVAAFSQNQTMEVRFPTKMKSITVSPGKSDGVDRYASFFNIILKDRKIRTVYQPIVDLKEKKIVGYEALTRAHPDYPIEEAALLFSVAREVDRVKELDEICVETALKTAQNLSPERKLFLNLNHETLLDPKIMKNLFKAKGVIGFKNIVIEVTEQSILRSFDKIREALFELKEQGVSVAIDDVGGGAVSLRDVAILKPDYMKFDRSLIRQIDISTTKQQIVISMIHFARSIHAITTAEGIETRAEFEAVLMCGIDIAQGYYFARPGEAFPTAKFD